MPGRNIIYSPQRKWKQKRRPPLKVIKRGQEKSRSARKGEKSRHLSLHREGVGDAEKSCSAISRKRERERYIPAKGEEGRILPISEQARAGRTVTHRLLGGEKREGGRRKPGSAGPPRTGSSAVPRIPCFVGERSRGPPRKKKRKSVMTRVRPRGGEEGGKGRGHFMKVLSGGKKEEKSRFCRGALRWRCRSEEVEHLVPHGKKKERKRVCLWRG